MRSPRIVVGARRHGMALLMVVLVLAALLMIGTPFILSMKLQEQGSIQTVAAQQARLAATTARNLAVSQLFESHPSRESEEALELEVGSPEGGDTTRIQVAPRDVDSLDELTVTLPDTLRLRPLGGARDGVPPEPRELSLRNAEGAILAVSVEDEQGKVNLNTAPPILLGNLLGGSQLSEDLDLEADLTEIPLVDTAGFPADDDPDTVDGVVVILNPLIFTLEAVSYRGKTDKALTGCFRGEYFSIPQMHRKGWPVFDLRALKVYLNRTYNSEQGMLRTYRTPKAIREIAEWSIVPYFLENLAMLGLNVRNMEDFGLTVDMLVRAGLDQALLERNEAPVDEDALREARKKLREVGAPKEALELLEKFRGPGALIEAAKLADQFEVGRAETAAFSVAFETVIKRELKKIQANTQKYFPKALVAYQQIFELPGLETFTASDYEALEDLITTHSTLPAEWTEEQVVIGNITQIPLLGFPTLQVANYSWFNPGTLIRVRSAIDPAKVEYHIAMGAIPLGNIGRGRGQRMRGTVFNGGIILKEPLRFEYAEREPLVSAALRHPVNVNTAPRRVIEAVLSGISLVDMGGQVRFVVTSEEARALAELLLENRPLHGFEDLRRLVELARERGILDEDQDERLILLNAINPLHNSLSVSTTGFCFASGDVYTVESTGLINSLAGAELARRRVREVIEVAPPDALTIELNSQADWTYHMFRRPAGRLSDWAQSSTWLAGREGNHMVTLPVALNERMFQTPSNTEGKLKALATETSANPYTFNSVEHFPNHVDGLSGSTHSMTTVQSERQAPGAVTASSAEVTDLLRMPGAVEFWLRFDDLVAGDVTLFDCASLQGLRDRNRVRLFYESGGAELVFQIMDDAAPGTDLPARSEPFAGGEVRHRFNFQPDTWYHLQAAWNSAAPGEQALFIDGRPVGQNIWLGTLRQSLPANSESTIVVESPYVENFPRRGALEVGTEVIDYVDRLGGVFTIRRESAQQNIPSGRGSRGSVAQLHRIGTQVRLFGYAVDALSLDFERLQRTIDLDDAAASVPIMEKGPDDIIIGRGGARLDHDLRPAQIEVGFGTAVPYPYPMCEAAVPITTSDAVVRVTSLNDPLTLGFPPNGYLMLRSRLPGASADAYEYVKYAGVRRASAGTGTPGGATFEFFGCGRGMEDTPALATSGPNQRAWVIGVSLRADLSSLTPANLREHYAPAGVIQIDRGFVTGSSTTIDASAPDVEWIYYARICKGGDHFLGDPRVRPYEFRGWSGFVRFSDNLADSFTGRYDTRALMAHQKGQRLIPVVSVTRAVVGVDDQVSIASSNPDAPPQFEQQLLRVRKSASTDLAAFVSFYDQAQPTQNYRLFSLPKIKKFPSGQLPSESSQQMTFAGPAPGVPTRASAALAGTIDEIRLSRTGDTQADFLALPMPDGRKVALDDAEQPQGEPRQVPIKVIRSWFEADAEPTPGGIDKLLLVGQGRLEARRDGDLFWQEIGSGTARNFGLGKAESLLVLGGEVFHYQDFDGAAEAEEPAIVALKNNLPRDPFADETSNDPRPESPWDLRTLVIPRVEVVPVLGQIPSHNGFLQFVSDGRAEILYYEYAAGNVLHNVLRGQLGTEVGAYTTRIERWGELVVFTNYLRALPTREVDLTTRQMLGSQRPRLTSLQPRCLVTLPHRAVTRTTSDFTALELSVVDTSGFAQEPAFLQFDDGNPQTQNEIFAVRGYEGNSFLLYRDDRTGKGIFRGRYGTSIDEGAGAGRVLVDFPVRYPDFYQPQIETSDLGYTQRSFTRPGAHWDRVTWQVEEQRNRSFSNEVRVIARLDGEPAWDAEPTNRPGGLYLFTDPKAANRIGQDANLLEIRIHFRFLPGSYGLSAQGAEGGWNDEWKHSPVLDRLTIEYRQPWRVVHREDLPF